MICQFIERQSEKRITEKFRTCPITFTGIIFEKRRIQVKILCFSACFLSVSLKKFVPSPICHLVGSIRCRIKFCIEQCDFQLEYFGNVKWYGSKRRFYVKTSATGPKIVFLRKSSYFTKVISSKVAEQVRNFFLMCYLHCFPINW